MLDVVVFEDKYAVGWDGAGRELETSRPGFGDVRPLREALGERYETDAHFALYSIPGENVVPRLNKSSLRYFETHPGAPLPVLNAVAVDVDFPDHNSDVYGWENRDEWPRRWEDWWAAVERAQDRADPLKHAGIYFTRGGLRFVWPLADDRRINAHLADSYLEQFKAYLARCDLPLDELTEWNRLYRLPFVRRDGVAQDYPADFSDMRPLEWEPPSDLRDESMRARGEAAREDMPDPDNVPDFRLSDLKPLEDRWFYRHLRNELPLADPGDRHDTIVEVVGAIVADLDTNDPLEPFQLILPSVRAMQRSEEPGDDHLPLEEVWDVCHWVCEAHDGASKVEESENNDFAAEQAAEMGVPREEVDDHLILASKAGGSYYVWDEGIREYASPTRQQSHLLALLDEHCPRLSRIRERDENTSASRLLQDYSKPIERLRLSYVADRTEFDPVRRELVEDVLERDPNLRPSRNPTIQGWLEQLFGDRVDEGLDWLSTFLDFSRATCALYIHGPPSIGKGLLASGLARFWRTTPVPYGDLLDDFQESLTRCPLIVADEEVPADPFRESGSSVFRQVIGTGQTQVNRKHRSKVELEGHPRVLITANDADALKIREALEEADLDAIQQRIGYVRTDRSPWEYLQSAARERGEPVQEMTDEWVAGGGIAQHVLWLREQRDVEIGDRFLVPGWESDLTRDLAIKFGGVPELGKYVCKVIRDRENEQGVLFGDGRLLVNLGFVRDSWSRIMHSKNPPSEKHLMSALKVLSGGERERLRPSDHESRRYYWSIDVDKIVRIAEEYHVTDAETIRAAVESTGEGSSFSSIPLEEIDPNAASG